MNKTVTINLSGIVFHIDEEAYQELGRYLAAIKKSFRDTEGGDEIIADIEARMAEIFKEKLSQNNVQVVTMLDVKDVIVTMGKPEEYTEEENKKETTGEKEEQYTTVENEIPYSSQKRMFRDREQGIIGGVCAGLAAYFNVDPIVFRVLFGLSFFIGAGFLLYIFLWIAIPAAKTEEDKKRMKAGFTTSSRKSYSSYSETAGKRLYRDPDDKIIGGVCSGLGAYFGVDPVFFRLAFIVALFGFGTGILLYLILMLVIPKALTTADKLRMKGEPINIHNIEKTFKEDVEDFKKKVNDFKKEAKDLRNPEHEQRFRNFFQDFIALLAQVFNGFFKVFGKVLGIFLVVIGMICLVAITAGIFGVSVVNFDGNSVTFRELYNFFIGNQHSYLLTLVGFFLLVGIPVLSMILSGTKLLFNLKVSTKRIVAAFGLLWAVGWGIALYQAITIAGDFSGKAKDSQLVELKPTSSDTLYLDVEKDTLFNSDEHDSHIRLNGKHFLKIESAQGIGLYNVNFDIVKSENENTSLTITRIARGSDRQEALKNAESIIYVSKQKDSLLLFDRFFTLLENEQWRKQEVLITLAIPEGKTVYLSPRMKDIIYDIDNVSDTYDSKMVRHYWMMKPAGLTCLDYNFMEESNNTQYEKVHGDSKNFDYKNFSELEIHGNFNLQVTKGEKYNVSLNGELDDLEDVVLELNGKELKIKNHGNLVSKVFDDAITITITSPHLTRLDLSGATTSNIEGFTENRMEVNLSGANETHMHTLEVQELSIDMSGASKLILSGHGDELITEQSGATSFNGLDYTVREASIEMNGASKAKVNATEKLNLDLNGACDVKYVGNPVINKDVSSPVVSVEKL